MLGLHFSLRSLPSHRIRDVLVLLGALIFWIFNGLRIWCLLDSRWSIPNSGNCSRWMCSSHRLRTTQGLQTCIRRFTKLYDFCRARARLYTFASPSPNRRGSRTSCSHLKNFLIHFVVAEMTCYTWWALQTVVVWRFMVHSLLWSHQCWLPISNCDLPHLL